MNKTLIPLLVITSLLHGCESTPHYNRTKVVNVGTPLPKKPYGSVKLYQSKEEVPSSYDVIAIMSVEGKAGAEAQFIKAFLYRAADLGADAVIFYRVSLAAGTELGQRYISTSIFTLPSDFDSWPDRYDGVLPQHIEQMRRNLHARDRFVKWAIDAGYSDAAVYRPMIKRWILHKLLDKAYQEKQVDTTVVALLVRSAITHGDDYHCVVTGDADILPAIRVAYPEYSKNVFVATTHPDELAAEHRQTSFSIALSVSDSASLLAGPCRQDHSGRIRIRVHALSPCVRSRQADSQVCETMLCAVSWKEDLRARPTNRMQRSPRSRLISMSVATSRDCGDPGFSNMITP